MGLIKCDSSADSFSSYKWSVHEFDLSLAKSKKLNILEIIVINIKEQLKIIEEGKSVIVNGKT